MVQTRADTKRIEDNGVQPNATPAQSESSIKRRPTAKRRRRGEPGELCRLNLDVLFLIAAYVHPIDLLNLARTCKSLRELLMGRASEFVWKTARRQTEGLPYCPPDLTEPEYANLVFYARCHGCGKYAKMILWNIRRRYCSDCRLTRLCPVGDCDPIIRCTAILPEEYISMAGARAAMWVDKQQMKMITDQYNRSSDKDRFIREKKDQYGAIILHVRECMEWEERLATDRREVMRARREERERSIFDRLKQLGFEPEIKYFSAYGIRASNKSFFKKSKPLTEKEWTGFWPELLQIMDSYRLRRLNATVYPLRQELLNSEYTNYISHPTPDMPNFDLLPHVDELSRFPPFQDIIKAPEGVEMGDKPFEAAFAQLPALVDYWRQKLEAEVAELVQIPDHLSSEDASKGKGHSTHTQPFQAASHKLNLACAVFTSTRFASTVRYPDVLHVISPLRDDDSLPIGTRFPIEFLKEAPYIVHACGFDPNVATVEDMDRRNARLKCLMCNDKYVRSWRDALLHGLSYYHGRSELAHHWKVVGDEHMDAIRDAELSVKTEWSALRFRCLLCRPRVGDMFYNVPLFHLESCHGIKKDDVEQGTHYRPLGIREQCLVEMSEEGGNVVFKNPVYNFVP